MAAAEVALDSLREVIGWVLENPSLGACKAICRVWQRTSLAFGTECKLSMHSSADLSERHTEVVQKNLDPEAS